MAATEFDLPAVDDLTEINAAESVPSGLDELRAAFRKRVADPRLVKRLPAAGGALAAEYRVLTIAESKEVFEVDDERDQNADALTKALVSIRRHDPTHPQADERGTVDLATWAGVDLGGPLRFDRRLLDVLGLELDDTSARAICLRMFDGNEIAMGGHSAQVMAWMTDTTSETLQDFALGS